MGVKFDFPKPVELVIYLISFYCRKDDIILDSFAGSGTTAHAVLNMNKKMVAIVNLFWLRWEIMLTQ